MKSPPRIYDCAVFRAVDGDTFKVSVDLGFNIQISVTIRINGINCEEMHDKDPEKKAQAKKAQEFARTFEGKEGRITVIGQDKYGRHVADLEVAGKFYAQEILKEGLAKAAVYALNDSEFEYELA